MVTRMDAITITFGDQAENHTGMQRIGQMASEGFTVANLQKAQDYFEANGARCHMHDLMIPQVLNNDYINLKYSTVAQNIASLRGQPAQILVIHGAVDALLGHGATARLTAEQLALTPDTKAKMYGRVVNKTARYNLCFSDTAQDPDYSQGKGRVVAFNEVPLLAQIRTKLADILGDKGRALYGEGNYYYDASQCGIGFHGDSERRKVVAIRLGPQTIPLHYQWFYQHQPVGSRFIINDIAAGDMYIMSDRAVGWNWKLSSIMTLRHAAGGPKFTTIKQ